MDATHTAGPWTVGYQAMDVWASDVKGHFKVCDIRGWGHLTGKGAGALGLPRDDAVKVQEANARLIAAAPDILAALKETLREYVQLVESGDAGNWNPENEPHVKEARAAIAKATGEPARQAAGA